MISSKFLSLSLTAVLLAATGCSTESRKGRDYVPGQSTDFEKESGTTFRVKSYKLDSSSVAEYNAYKVPKKKQFNYSVCLQDANGGAFTTGVRVQILDEQGNEAQCRAPDLKFGACVADYDGCVKWSEIQEYPHLSPSETYYKFKRIVRAGRPYNGAVTVNLVLNPWDGSWATSRDNSLPADIPVVDAEGALTVNGGRILKTQSADDLRFGLDAVTFAFEKVDYANFEITRLLGLTVAHQYRVSFKPTVIRKTYNGLDRVDSLVNGRFKLYFALFREQNDPSKQFDIKNLISSSAFTASDSQSAGNYLSQVTFKIENIADLTSRTVALVTLQPMDDNSVGEKSFWAYVKPGRLSTLALYPSGVSARDFNEQAAVARVSQNGKKAVDLMRASGFREIVRQPASFVANENETPVQDSIAESFEKMIRDQNIPAMEYLRLQQVMCEKIYGPYPAPLKSCQRDPFGWLTINKRDLVENILSQPRKVNVRAITEGFKMSVAYSYSVSNSTSLGGKLSAGLSIGKSGPLGILTGSMGADLFYSTNYTIGWGRTTSAAVGSDITVTSEGHTFEFETETRTCVIVVPDSDQVARVQRRTPAFSPHPAFACNTKTRKQTRDESYFLLVEGSSAKDSLFSDYDTNAEASWRFFIRGQGTKNLLYKTLQGSDFLLTLEKIPSDDYLSRLPEFSMMQEYPGFLAPRP